MNTIIIGSNHLKVNFYSSFFEMLGLDVESYNSISVGIKRVPMNNSIVNIVILLENREEHADYSKQQFTLDPKQYNIIFICMTEDLLALVSGRDMLVFNHFDIIDSLALPLVKNEICSSEILSKTKCIKPEDIIKYIQSVLLKNKINLPIKNECAIKMLAILEDDGVSFKTIDLMSQSDPVLHSGIIKMANSVYFGGAFSNVMTIEKALVRVGISNVKTYLISYVTKSIASNKDLLFHEAINTCVDDSLVTASLCYAMAENFKVASPITMFSIGLMSSLGEIFMYTALSDYFSRAEFDSTSASSYAALIQNTGLMITGKLLSKWKMAEDYILPVANCKSLSNNKYMKETRILHLAMNMHNYIETSEMDANLESALSNTRVEISEPILGKIVQDALRHLNDVKSLLN